MFPLFFFLGLVRRGREADHQQKLAPADLLHFDRRSHFGVTSNYTYVNSSVNYGTTAAPILNDLLDLSRHAANGTLYYEDDKFSARVSNA